MKAIPSSSRHDGFSLVELSIVLVILGLLTGGILAGQDLIRAAELRSVTTEHQEFQAAVNTFRNKYMALPGDMDNAERFWGTDPDGCPSHAVRVVKEETCNGDGDGKVGKDNATYPEQFRFWQHLANAGLIKGSYTGITGPGHNVFDEALIGDNVPASGLGNAGWSIWTNTLLESPYNVSDNSYFEGSYGNWPLVFGNENPTEETNNPALTPEEAWNIDTKADDGKPGTGFIRPAEGATGMDGSCHDHTTHNDPASEAEYILTNSDIACHLIFIN